MGLGCVRRAWACMHSSLRVYYARSQPSDALSPWGGCVPCRPRRWLFVCVPRLRAVFEETMGAALPVHRKYIVLDMTMDNGSEDVIIPQVQFFFA